MSMLVAMYVDVRRCDVVNCSGDTWDRRHRRSVRRTPYMSTSAESSYAPVDREPSRVAGPPAASVSTCTKPSIHTGPSIDSPVHTSCSDRAQRRIGRMQLTVRDRPRRLRDPGAADLEAIELARIVEREEHDQLIRDAIVRIALVADAIVIVVAIGARHRAGEVRTQIARVAAIVAVFVRLVSDSRRRGSCRYRPARRRRRGRPDVSTGVSMEHVAIGGPRWGESRSLPAPSRGRSTAPVDDLTGVSPRH